MTRRVSAIVAAALLALAAPASAQPREEARRAYQQGLAAFDARDFATALARFQQAYRLTQRHEFLVNIAVTFEQIGRTADAVETYRRYLSLVPNAPDRPLLEARIARLNPPPPPRPPPPASTTPQTVSPAPSPVSPRPAARPVWPWVVLGSGLALAAGGTMLLTLPGDPGEDRSIDTEQAYLDAVSRRETYHIVGGVALGLGVAAVMVGTVALVSSRGSTRTAVTPSGVVLAHGGMLTLSGAF